MKKLPISRRRGLAACVVGIASAVGLLAGQSASPAGTTFRIYLLGREAGRETNTVSSPDAGTRRLVSTVSYTDRGADIRLTSTFDAALDGTPRHLVVRGQPFRDGTTDLDVTVQTVPSFPLDGALPVGLQEQLIRYWRNRGRPGELPSAPGSPIHIEQRAQEQIDLGGRSVTLDRLAIDGPTWGKETAWVEPNGSLAALTTWASWVPMIAVREGFEMRLARFLEEAARDRMADVDRLTNLSLPEQAEGVVLTGATVIVGGKRPPIPDATVVIKGDRIAAVGPSARTKPPEDLPKVDVRGMTIIAGLWDMQAQISHGEWMPAYLAAGVTSVRTVATDSPFLASLRESMTTGRIVVGPRMVYAGYVDGGSATPPNAAAVGTPEDGRQAVRHYRGDGIRQIELGPTIGLPVLRAVALEAHRFGLILSGPVPNGISTQQALDAGLDQVESLPPELSSDSAMSATIALLVARHSVLEPLAAWDEILRRPAGTPVSRFQPGIARAPGAIGRMMSSLGGAVAARGGSLASLVSFVRAARTAGLAVVPGTNGGVPGFSLHREIELFVDAGMTPFDALQAATSVPAQLMKMDDSGTVESGKRADLVVLTGNPLEKISNLRTAKWVVANGKLYDCEKLWKAVGFK